MTAKTPATQDTARTVLAALLIELVSVRADTRRYLSHYDLIRLAETAIDSTNSAQVVHPLSALGTTYVSTGHLLADDVRRAYTRAGHVPSSYDQYSGIIYEVGTLLSVICAWGGIGE